MEDRLFRRAKREPMNNRRFKAFGLNMTDLTPKKENFRNACKKNAKPLAIRKKAIGRLEAIAGRLEAIASRVEVPSLVRWRPSLVGWRSTLVGWRPSLVGWRPLLLGWRPLLVGLVGWRPSLVGWRPSLLVTRSYEDQDCAGAGFSRLSYNMQLLCILIACTVCAMQIS